MEDTAVGSSLGGEETPLNKGGNGGDQLGDPLVQSGETADAPMEETAVESSLGDE